MYLQSTQNKSNIRNSKHIKTMKLTTAICTLAVAGCVATQVSGQVNTKLLKAADSLEAEHCLTTAEFLLSMPAPEGADWVIPKMIRECAEYHTKACCGKLKEGCLPTFFDDLKCYEKCLNGMIANGNEYSVACKAKEIEIIKSVQYRNLFKSRAKTRNLRRLKKRRRRKRKKKKKKKMSPQERARKEAKEQQKRQNTQAWANVAVNAVGAIFGRL